MVGRLARRSHFRHLRAHGTTLREGRLRITVARPPSDTDLDGPAVAFAIGRHHGSAVRRNRTRRRLRAVVSATERDGLLPARWYLVTVLTSTDEPTSIQLDGWFRRGVGRLGNDDGTFA